MEEEVKAVRTIREFVDWYEKREEMPSNKLHEFYIKFKYILEQEDEADEAIRKFLG
jgi:predicted solute-binding protein